MTTKTTIALADLVEKGADGELLRDMIQYVAQRMMELDTEGLCAAAYGEQNPERRLRCAPTAATATASGSGRHAPARWI